MIPMKFRRDHSDGYNLIRAVLLTIILVAAMLGLRFGNVVDFPKDVRADMVVQEISIPAEPVD